MFGLIHSTALQTHQECTSRANKTMHLFLRMFAPKQEHHTAALHIHGIDNRVSKLLPAKSLVRRRFVRSHCERSVEEQNALAGPVFQAAVAGTGENNSRIFEQLFIHVDQGWRGSDAIGNTEAQPVRLAVIVIPAQNWISPLREYDRRSCRRGNLRILPHNDSANIRQRGQMQSSKPNRGCWMQAASAARAVQYKCLTPLQHHASGVNTGRFAAAAAAAWSASGDVLGGFGP